MLVLDNDFTIESHLSPSKTLVFNLDSVTGASVISVSGNPTLIQGVMLTDSSNAFLKNKDIDLDTFMGFRHDSLPSGGAIYLDASSGDNYSSAIWSYEGAGGQYNFPDLGGGAAKVVCEVGNPKSALKAVWIETAIKTNVGTSYVNVYSSPEHLNGENRPVDSSNCKQYRVLARMKVVGSGDQNLRLVDGSSAELHNFSTSGAGEKELDSGWQSIPAGLGEMIKPQIKSTVSQDDPIVRSIHIWLR